MNLTVTNEIVLNLRETYFDSFLILTAITTVAHGNDNLLHTAVSRLESHHTIILSPIKPQVITTSPFSSTHCTVALIESNMSQLCRKKGYRAPHYSLCQSFALSQ